MDITLIGLLILIFIIIYSTWKTFYRKCNLPPGPTPLPVIGTLLHIKRGRLVDSLMKLWDRYGAVYTMYFGSRTVVVLCGYEAVKEALIDRGEEFGARGPLPLLERFTQGYVSFFQRHNGRTWNIAKTSEKAKKEVKGQRSVVVHQYADLSPEADNQKRDYGVDTECHSAGTVSRVF